MLENEEPGKNTEKESLGENPRNAVSLKPREKNILSRKWLLTVLNDAEILSKVRMKRSVGFDNMEIISDLEKNSLEEKEKRDKATLQKNLW